MGKYQELIERLNRPAWWDLENDCSLLEEAEAAVRKLEEYVETGLEPCDYSAMRDALQKAERAQADLAEMLRIVGNIGLDRLMELAKAEQEGRLVVLPCGTDVNLIRDGHTYKADHWNHTLTAFRDAPENKSGKQVALFSIEEAEAALKGDPEQ